jgi:hypothetical protein
MSRFYRITEISRTKVKRFNAEAILYNIQFINLEEIHIFTIHDIFEDILNEQLVDYSPDQMVGLEINNSSLDRRVLIPFTPIGQMCVDKILSVFERVQQSKHEFQLDQNMVMKLVVCNRRV